MSERVTSTHRGGLGGVEWHAPSAVYVWFGPGGGLYLVFGGSLVRIEHPAASGTYETSTAARRALDAFLGAVPAQEEVVALHKRIRQEAKGLTRDQVKQRLSDAERIGTQAEASDVEFETYQEWYGISFVMQPGRTGHGMDVYDPAKDGRPL